MRFTTNISTIEEDKPYESILCMGNVFCRFHDASARPDRLYSTVLIKKRIEALELLFRPLG